MSGDFIVLTKPDGDVFAGSDCNGNFFGADSTTVNGIPFEVGPYLAGGSNMAGLLPNGTYVPAPTSEALIEHVYMIFPGGRCSAQPLDVTFEYSDGGSYTTGTLSITHDCSATSTITATDAVAYHQGNYGGPCCAEWYQGTFTNPSPADPVEGLTIYYTDGCGGSYNGQMWALTVD